MVAEFIFFASPVFIALFNARLHRADENGRRSGLASFYKTVAVLSVLNFLYFCYSLFTYYPSCGSGRHGCSIWKDFTVNVASQLRFWDFLFTSVLVWIFFMREQSRNPRAPNAWQYIAYAIVGSTPYALASNFAARLRMNDEILIAQKNKRLLQQWQQRSQRPQRATASPSRRPLNEQEKKTYKDQWHAELSANSVAIIFYSILLILSFSVWLPNINSVLASYLDFYSNYCNKFIAHALLLMWTSLATRIIALSDISILRVVFLVTPLFSVSSGFALFLLSREMARDRGNREEFHRILRDGVDVASDSLLLSALSGDLGAIDADSLGPGMLAVASAAIASVAGADATANAVADPANSDDHFDEVDAWEEESKTRRLPSSASPKPRLGANGNGRGGIPRVTPNVQ